MPPSDRMDAEEAVVRAYYERGEERDRLSEGRGQLEYIRTTEIVARRLPPPPAVIADIGGGPGRYALWLASLGYQVEHRDLMPLHVTQLLVDAAAVSGIRSALGDARELDLPDASADAVLLLGPLYHLARRADRIAAVGEAARILRPGGTLFAAAISRWATRIDGIIGKQIYLKYPAAVELIDEAERAGVFPPLHAGAFSAYSHRPDDLRAELTEAGLEVTDLVSVEGPGMILADLDARMADPADRAAILDGARALERVPELIGFGPHLLATAILPAAGCGRQPDRRHDE
jgi:SAM-dependent methyltransferase